MKGSIRLIGGIVLAMGGAGGVETSMSNSALMTGVAIAAVGLALMYSGVNALKGNQ